MSALRRWAVGATLALLVGCGGATPRDRNAEDERARMLVRAGTAPPRPLPEEPEPPEPEFSASDAALIRAGNVLDLLSRRAEAVKLYIEALAEPDHWGYKEYAERALKRPFVLEGEFTVDPR